LKYSVLGLDGDDLVAHEFQDSIHDWLKTLQDLFVRKGHITLLDAGVRKFSFDTDIDCPLLSIIAEISLDAVFKVHDTFCINFASCFRSIRKFHFSDFCSENVAEISI